MLHRIGTFVLLILVGCTVLAGCKSTTTPVTSAGSRTLSNRPDTSGGSASADQAVATDPCAMRLHDISGAILFYYAVNKQLPQKLTDLQEMAGLDAPLVFTCPDSGQPYIYNPAGLQSPGGSKRIIVYDAVPTHNNHRWCLLMPPIRRGAAASVEVLELPESVFLTYQNLGD